MHISFHGNARKFFDYPKRLAAYLATCEAFHIVKKDCTESNMMGEPESNTLQRVDFTGTILILDAFSLLIRASCELGSIWASKRSTAKERCPSKEAPVSPVSPVLPLFFPPFLGKL